MYIIIKKGRNYDEKKRISTELTELFFKNKDAAFQILLILKNIYVRLGWKFAMTATRAVIANSFLLYLFVIEKISKIKSSKRSMLLQPFLLTSVSFHQK